jgi:hypothetical protein
MGGRAEFEQHIFSDARDGQLGRTFIAHFERVLPGNDFAFDYPRLTMVQLGRHEYLHQSWPTDDWELFQSADMRRLLASRSLTAPARWLVNRYVRAVDRARQSELILFYLEPAGELPASVADLQLGGGGRDLWEPIGRELAERANAVFSIRD